MGYCVSRNADVGNKVVWKANWSEKVGVVAQRNGRPAIVEYSELSEAKAKQVDKTNKLVFGAGNICNHYFTVRGSSSYLPLEFYCSIHSFIHSFIFS